MCEKHFYYMANPVLCKSLCSDWFFLGQDFAVRTVSMETVQPVYFCFGAKLAIQNLHFTIRNRVPYNKQLTNRACSGRTGEYWPEVVAVRTSLRSVRTATTSGQYSPVRPEQVRLVSGYSRVLKNSRVLI